MSIKLLIPWRAAEGIALSLRWRMMTYDDLIDTNYMLKLSDLVTS